MFRTAGRSRSLSAGCWRHSFIVGEATCDGCGTRCCKHCWVEAPRGSLCIECALVFGGVRAPRRGVAVDRAAFEPVAMATMSWDESAGLVDLTPVHAARGRVVPLFEAEPFDREELERAA